ncbi:hypothetical protein, partial [Rhizobium leguminosarum]|uniref:hypothetical protein n=1 Tax=Rhizobium leguminosarum TaxID=384 RepID=UPI0019814525
SHSSGKQTPMRSSQPSNVGTKRWNQSTRRSSIAAQGEDHTFDVSDGKGQFDVRRGSHLEAMMFEVEAVAKELVRRAQQDFAEANNALSKLVPLLNDRLQLGVNFTGT